MAVTLNRLYADVAESAGKTFEEIKADFEALDDETRTAMLLFANAMWRRGALDMKDYCSEYVDTFYHGSGGVERVDVSAFCARVASHLSKIEVNIIPTK